MSTPNEEFHMFVENKLSELGIVAPFRIALSRHYSFFTPSDTHKELELKFHDPRIEFVYNLRGGNAMLSKWVGEWQQESGETIFSLNLQEYLL